MPGQTLFEYLEGGQTLEDLLEGFPTVSREHAIEALEEAKHLVVIVGVMRILLMKAR